MPLKKLMFIISHRYSNLCLSWPVKRSRSAASESSLNLVARPVGKAQRTRTGRLLARRRERVVSTSKSFCCLDWCMPLHLLTFSLGSKKVGPTSSPLVSYPTEVVNGGHLHRVWGAQLLRERSPHAKTTRSHSHHVRD